MNIHLIGSKGNIEQEIDYYRKIVKYIKGQGHTFVRDWVEETYQDALNGKVVEQESFDWAKVDTDDAAAISRADLIIVEATKKSFFVGYRMAQAVQQKKPILILYRDNSFPGASDLSRGSDFMYAAEYNDQNYEKIISKFIEDNTISVKDMRFNFFIDRPIYNYLRWAALRTGKTKAEILRELVQREIDNKDY